MRILLALFTLVMLTISSAAFAADVHVDGYYRKDGTYVQPHYRSAPDSSHNNNWSTQGNTNPYTGQAGTQPRDPYEGNSYGGSQPQSTTQGYGSPLYGN